MYQGHSQQAADLGLAYGTPAYNQWIAANRQGMINQGMNVGDRYTSGDWIRYQGLLDQAENPTPVIDVTGRDLG